jgi:gamma-glutamyl:cysteine ligase YbdK (ATP-grasp superfamily)
MLPEFAHKLQLYYARYEPARDGSLASFLVANSSAVSDVLLGVADGRARKSGHETVKKAYQKLRPQAKKHVEHALPALGDLIERYAKAVDAAA